MYVHTGGEKYDNLRIGDLGLTGCITVSLSLSLFFTPTNLGESVVYTCVTRMYGSCLFSFQPSFSFIFHLRRLVVFAKCHLSIHVQASEFLSILFNDEPHLDRHSIPVGTIFLVRFN